MSNAFPSMISNEPPPLEQSEDEEDSEGLQNLGHGLNLDLDPSPMATPIKIPSIASDGNTILETTASQLPKVSSSNHSSLRTSDEPILSTLEPSDASASSLQTTVSDTQSANPRSPSISDVFTSTVLEDNCENDIPVVTAVPDSEGIETEDNAITSQHIEQIANSKENVREEVVTNINFQSCDEDDSCDEFVSYEEPKSITKEENAVSELSEENEGATVADLTPKDFVVDSEADLAENAVEDDQFDSPAIAENVGIETVPVEEVTSVYNVAEEASKSPQPDTALNDFGAIEEDDEFGEFADFASFEAFPAPASEPIPQVPTIPKNETVTEVSDETTAADDDDDFDDFDDFQTADPQATPAAIVEPVIRPPQSTGAPALHLPKLTASRADALVQGLFVKEFSLTDIQEETLHPIDSEIKHDGKERCWKKVEDFEGSQGLMFKWTNSVAYQNLLRSLNIDNTTIMYKGKWGIIEVPRFAASLVESPLLPESGSKGLEAAQTQFDDFSGGKPEMRLSDDTISGDVPSPIEDQRPQDTASKLGGVSRNGLSAEAERILSQLPDLSYMRAKTLVFHTDLPT